MNTPTLRPIPMDPDFGVDDILYAIKGRCMRMIRARGKGEDCAEHTEQLCRLIFRLERARLAENGRLEQQLRESIAMKNGDSHLGATER